MSCAIIPFDEIGCLNINLVAGMRKLVPLSFNITANSVVTPIDLSLYDGISLNVYNMAGTSPVPALSKTLGDGISLPTNTSMEIDFKEETLNLSGEYYYNIEFLRTGFPSEFYVQGYIKIKGKKDFVKKTITTSV